MTNNKKFYVTTPIYYPNAAPHAGSAYTTIAADILSRWNSLLGKEVYFLTGTDDHGQKIQEVAEGKGLKPKQFVDEIVKGYKELFKSLNITNNDFVRTTDKDHESKVKVLLQELYDKKLIYKGVYESYYCVGCEQYKTQRDLVDGKCPDHNKIPELKKEEAYMFKLSSFQKELLIKINSGEFEILPLDKRDEMISFIEEGLQDISISRRKEKVYWGVELPFDKEHTCYVWVDAFWNYITGLRTESNVKKFWPVNVQLMAKDILRVHATIWPALLLASGMKLPEKLFVHGYFTVAGKKMSKTLGNVIDPKVLVGKYGSDSLRYFFMRAIPFGQDGDFSERALVDRHNGELLNKYGNLISRVTSLAEKFGFSRPKKNTLIKGLDVVKIKKLFDSFELDKALAEIFSFIDSCNEFVQSNELWLGKSDVKDKLYELLLSIRNVTILLSPFIPDTAVKVSELLKFKISFDGLDKSLTVRHVKKSDPLFKKLEFFEEEKDDKINKDKSVGIVKMSEIKFEDWEKLDLRVGLIKSVDDIPDADKLYKLSVDLGKELGVRIIVSGLKEHYKPKELLNNKFVFITNLLAKKLKGISSHGMILAASSDNHSKVVLLRPDKDIAVGSRIS